MRAAWMAAFEAACVVTASAVCRFPPTGGLVDIPTNLTTIPVPEHQQLSHLDKAALWAEDARGAVRHAGSHRATGPRRRLRRIPPIPCAVP